jgi:hypothetical protein
MSGQLIPPRRQHVARFVQRQVRPAGIVVIGGALRRGSYWIDDPTAAGSLTATY